MQAPPTASGTLPQPTPLPEPAPAPLRAAAAGPPADEMFYDEVGPDPMGQRSQGDQLKRLLFDLLGRWYWIVLGLVLGILFGFYQVSKSPKIYRATATLLVRERNPDPLPTPDTLSEMNMGSVVAMNTVASRIRRHELLERVGGRPDIRGLGGLVPEKVSLVPDWAAAWFGGEEGEESEAGEEGEESGVPEAATVGGMISQWMETSVRKGTRLLDVSIEHPLPEVAKTLADAVTSEYVTEMATDRFTGRSAAITLLEGELDGARVRLQDATTAQTSYQRALETHALLEAKENEVVELNRRYLAKHPKLIQGKAQLEDVQEQFLTEFEAARKSLTDKKYWDSVAAELEAAAGDPDQRLATAREKLLARTQLLSSEINSSNTVYTGIDRRIKELLTDQQQTEAPIRISSRARTPNKEVKPNPPMVLAKAGIGGLALGLGLAFLLVKLDTKVRGVEQLEQETGLPVLGVIGDLQPRRLAAAARRDARRTSGNGRDLPTIPAAQELWDPQVVFREGLSSSSYAEMFQALRASVTLLGDEHQRKVSLFLSSIPGEGKTTVAANFALASGRQGRRTLLIDFDLRQPTMHEVFGLTPTQRWSGLSEVLSGRSALSDACVALEGAPNVDVLLSGRRSRNPGELLHPARLGGVLTAAREQYDVVVVDTAPLLAVPDTRLLAPFADNLCVVVRSQVTPIAALRRAQQMLEEAGTQPTGMILNGYARKRGLVGKDYSYGFNEYGRYGRGDDDDEIADDREEVA